MSPLRVLRGLVFGAIGGVVGWFLIEFLPLPYPFQQHKYDNLTHLVVDPARQAMLGLVLGGAIGAFLGIAEGLGQGTMSRFKRTFWIFLVLGALGGFLGLFFGQFLFGLMGGKVDVTQIRPEEFIVQTLARALGWMLIGLFLGAVFGLPNMSWRRSWNGAVGGAIGGFLGGFVFRMLEYTRFLASGFQLRLLGFIILGACIGFFINLVAEVMKRVWVRVLIGRNEGREHTLDTAIAYVGRDELAEVPVFLDPAVPKRMASFRLTNGRYGLYPESNALPITVNGQPLAPGQILRDGDAIQFGRVTLAYNEKATATGSVRPVDTIALADFSVPSVIPGAVPIPNAPNVCEFCGQQRDPATGACACTVPADAGYAAPAGYGPPAYDAGGFAQPPTMAYGQDFGQGGYGQPAYPAGDPAYAATVMDPGGYGGPVPSPGSGPRLVAFEGPYAGQVFPLTTAEAGIGRDPAQDISLSADTTTSRRHARLYNAGGGWVLRDEGSSNGTWVNGVRIQEQALFPGDAVRVGHTQFRFEI